MSYQYSVRLSRTCVYFPQNFAREVKKILGVHQLFSNFCPIFRNFCSNSKKNALFSKNSKKKSKKSLKKS